MGVVVRVAQKNMLKKKEGKKEYEEEIKKE